MLRPRRKFNCLVLCAVGTTLCAQQTLAAEWRIEPSAYIGTSYADNPRLLTTGGSSSAGAVGELNATLQRLTQRSELWLRPRLSSARYNDDESLSSDDQYLTAGHRWLSERSQWNTEVGLTRDTTLTSELGLAGLVQANRRHEAITFSAGPTFTLTERVSAGAQLYWLDSHYVDARLTGLVDYDYRSVSLFSSLALAEVSSLTVTAQTGELTSAAPGGATTRDGTLRLAWTYRPWMLWTVALSGGPSYVESGAGSDTGVVFDGEIKRQAERWSFTTAVGRTQSPTGRGVLTRRDRLAFSVNRSLTERLSATIAAQWIRNEDLLARPDGATYEVDYGRLDLSANWRLAQHWSLALQLGGNTQDHELAPRRAEGYRASLSMVWNGQPQSL